ncbi:hypothetical protein SFRURICE_009189 [Spodoptera frugiperda]|nr:hypothetical protein SFRURICE_009189 [Spodoptera frugiperda]
MTIHKSDFPTTRRMSKFSKIRSQWIDLVAASFACLWMLQHLRITLKPVTPCSPFDALTPKTQSQPGSTQTDCIWNVSLLVSCCKYRLNPVLDVSIPSLNTGITVLALQIYYARRGCNAMNAKRYSGALLHGARSLAANRKLLKANPPLTSVTGDHHGAQCVNLIK